MTNKTKLVPKPVTIGKYPGQTQSSLNATEITNRSKRIKVSLPKINFKAEKDKGE